MTKLKSCGVCCGIFSIFAIVFLLIVGAILRSGSDIIDVATDDDRSRAAANCFIGAAIYAGFFVLSLACFFIPCPNSRKKEDEIKDGRQRLMPVRQQE